MEMCLNFAPQKASAEIIRHRIIIDPWTQRHKMESMSP